MNIGHWCMAHQTIAAVTMILATIGILIAVMLTHKTKQDV